MKLFDSNNELENKQIYTDKELTEGLHKPKSLGDTLEMENDRSILAPIDIFNMYTSKPKIYENILSELDVDEIIDWIFKKYNARRPNRYSPTSHWGEKDLVMFLTHPYKEFFDRFQNLIKDILPFYDHDDDHISGNFYFTVRGYDLHHDFLYYNDYKKLISKRPKVKYFIPYKALIIPLFSMSDESPPYEMNFTVMNERCYGFGQTLGDALELKLQSIGDPTFYIDKNRDEGKCLMCSTTQNLIHEKYGKYYNICIDCVPKLDRCWLSPDEALKMQDSKLAENFVYTGRYRQVITRESTRFYNENGFIDQKHLDKFHLDLAHTNTNPIPNGRSGRRWNHVAQGNLVGMSEEMTVRWRPGDIIVADSTQIHISSNSDKVKAKAGLMLNISKPIYGI